VTFSSEATRGRAKRLAEEIGASHLNVNIDVVVRSLLTLFETLFPGKKLRYKVCFSFSCYSNAPFPFRSTDLLPLDGVLPQGYLLSDLVLKCTSSVAYYLAHKVDAFVDVEELNFTTSLSNF